MPPGGELRHPIAEVWSRPWAGTRPTIKPVPPESHLPGTASSKRRRGAGGARGKRAHLGGSEGLADGLSGEPRTGAGFSPRREPGGADDERASPTDHFLYRLMPRFQPPGLFSWLFSSN